MSLLLCQAMFAPRSIALVGASGDPAKVGSRPLRYLRANGYGGAVHPVNPRGGTIEGYEVFLSLEDLPDVPDHAYLLTGADVALDALKACVALGVPLVSILADGFAEGGAVGAARHERMLAAIAESGTRVLGPNCMGLANPGTGLMLTANASFGMTQRHAGGVMLASQSGTLIGTLLSRGAARGIGFSRLISVGNEGDLDAAEVCLACMDEPEVTGFALFLETIRNGETLSRLAWAAAEAGKPVVAMKTGRSAIGQALAVTHTGAMLAEDDMTDAALRDLGIARVHQLEALFEALPLLAVPNVVRSPRITLVTTTGGGAALVADRLGLSGVEPIPVGPNGRAALEAAGIAAPQGPILDLTLAGARPAVLDAAIGSLVQAAPADGAGAVVATVGSSAAAQPDEIMPAILRHGRGSVPLAVFVVPEAPLALALAAAAGVAAFRTPEACADAVAALLARRPPRASIPEARREGGARRVLDEGESLEWAARLGIPAPRAVELTADAVDGGLPFPGPYVVKVAAPALGHKSEAGGVLLGVADGRALTGAVARMAADVERATGQVLERVRVAAQVTPLAELMLGYRRDPVFGPVVILSAGGIDVELTETRAIRLAPVDEATAAAMIDGLPLARRLAGYRGRAAADRRALVRAIVAMSAPGCDVIEAEINPLGAFEDGVLALDALFVVEDKGEER